jgi:hypothetical protein
MKNIHEKIITRASGIKIKITVELQDAIYDNLYRYTVLYKKNDRQEWFLLLGRQRRILAGERVTKEEILQAKLELWQKLKPK